VRGFKVKLRKYAGILGLVSVIIGCQTSSIQNFKTAECEFVFRIPSMGTAFEVQYVDKCENRYGKDMLDAISSRLESMESSMSLYQKESDISRLNRTGRIIGADPDFVAVTRLGLWHSEMTEGYFDVTIWPLLEMIQRNFDQRKSPPPPAALREKAKLVDFRLVEVRGRAITLKKKGMGISLDGIAKGFAVDAAAEILKRSGIRSYVVNFSGNMRVRGIHADGTRWKIVMLNPVTAELLPVPSGEFAVASSGIDFAKYSDDGRWHHLIDPKTHRPANKMLGSSIIGPSAAVCDILSTATFVMGPKVARKIMLRKYPDYSYWFVNKDGSTETNVTELKRSS
jgi:FAD:protein FMN transferase